MTRLLCLAAALVISFSSLRAADKLPPPLVTGMKNPESVAVGPDGRIYVTVIGEFDRDGDGAVVVIEKGKALPFASGLNDPKGLAVYQQWLYTADKDRVLRIDRKGKVEVYAARTAFPRKPLFLNDVQVDPESGIIYVSDSGDLKGKGGMVYRITPNRKVSVVLDGEKHPNIKSPNGLLLDSATHLLLLDAGTGELHRLGLVDGKVSKIAEGFGVGDGLAFDRHGRLYLSDWQQGKVYAIGRPGDKPVLLAEGFQSAADICLDPTNQRLLVPDMKAGTLTAIPAQPPGYEVDVTPLALETSVSFPDLKWTGWKAETASGLPNPLRPLVLTHAGDGSNRVFVATQHGVIYHFANDQKAKDTQVFLDISSKVRYSDKENEEGFLGLAFHPRFKTNGEFFVFYTDKKARLENVVCRYRVRKDNPAVADPDSEEELLRIKRPFWNHDGGTLCFGPEGYLYVALGDGGLANDPYGNGQKLSSILGKILRLDVDRKDKGKNYAIPADNPFVERKEAAPEIWCYGLRNVWRMSFDRKTGQLWAADVGQNLWEEINLIRKGGNYGWNLREALHPFGAQGVGPRPDLLDPIWEYHHDIGKSITGGHVYRGKQFPELDGHYLYADYVTAKIWALRYDDGKKRVVANRPIRDRSLPILSFGEDEQGEVYLLTYSPTGQGIYRLQRQK